jgi:hypothetical protein
LIEPHTKQRGGGANDQEVGDLYADVQREGAVELAALLLRITSGKIRKGDLRFFQEALKLHTHLCGAESLNFMAYCHLGDQRGRRKVDELQSIARRDQLIGQAAELLPSRKTTLLAVMIAEDVELFAEYGAIAPNRTVAPELKQAYLGIIEELSRFGGRLSAKSNDTVYRVLLAAKKN